MFIVLNTCTHMQWIRTGFSGLTMHWRVKEETETFQSNHSKDTLELRTAPDESAILWSIWINMHSRISL